jgi:ribonuclease HIII
VSVSATLSDYVSGVQDHLSRSGIETRHRRELANGIRVEFSRGSTCCGINFYHSDRKGFSIVPSGGDTVLADRILALLSASSAGPDPIEESSLSPADTWIGTDEASSATAGGTGSEEGTFLTGTWIGTDEASCLTGTWIGTDEAGKGDYMGPLTVAAMLVNAPLAEELKRRGVRDSKTLTDRALAGIADGIKRTSGGRFAVVSMAPLEYNRKLEQLNAEGKNSLDLLAECHARAIEELLARGAAPDRVIIDRFCSGKRIVHLLPEGGYRLELRERGESDTAVAAASILARDAYMKALAGISEEYGIGAVPGSGAITDRVARQFVDEYGPDVLYRIAKVHFKNTSRVLSLFG